MCGDNVGLLKGFSRRNDCVGVDYTTSSMVDKLRFGGGVLAIHKKDNANECEAFDGEFALVSSAFYLAFVEGESFRSALTSPHTLWSPLILSIYFAYTFVSE